MPKRSKKDEAPLDRQNSKAAPPSPPRIIYGGKSGHVFQRVDFLGEVCVMFRGTAGC